MSSKEILDNSNDSESPSSKSAPRSSHCYPRFSCWAGQGLPKAWAENMGLEAGDVVYPIVDNETCGQIDGWPRPEQMLCWCPSSEKQSQVVEMLRRGCGIDVNEDWEAL